MSDPTSVAFRVQHEPALTPGEYCLTVTHRLANTAPVRADGSDRFDEKHQATLDFAVGGERFRLDPGEVLAYFPPPASRGDHANALPHVVLKRRSLPWERSALSNTPGGPPWLAILVFDSAEAPKPKSILVGDLQRAPFDRGGSGKGDDPEPSRLPVDVASYADFNGQSFPLAWGERFDQPCQAIDVPVQLLIGLLPTQVGLGWLTHVRASQSGDGSTETSVVVATRLPVPKAASTVHLVSLENLSAILPPDDTTPPPATLTPPGGTAATAVRLVTLASWSFICDDPTGTFAGYLEHLDTEPATLRLPDSTEQIVADPVVESAVALGYSALVHQTRLGDATVSWYRGPLLPSPSAVGAGAASDALPFDSADAAVRYDPETGMFDVSLAAAWQLGRMQALASKSFSSALFAFKRAAQQKTAKAATRHAASSLCAAIPGASDPLAAVTGLLAGALRRELTGHQPEPAVPEPLIAPLHATAPPAVLQRTSLRAAFRRSHTELLADHGALETLHADTPVPPAVVAWLQELVTLGSTPLGYLVPDETMLPAGRGAAPPYGSIRFFVLDPAWMAALVDGACSIGRASAADAAIDRVLSALLQQAAGPLAAASGFLLRSPVVAGWPQLRVDAYRADGTLVDDAPVIQSVIAPSTLLYLVPALLERVEIHEPTEALHFGLDPLGDEQYEKYLRWVTVPSGAPPDAQPGHGIDGATPSPVVFRPSGAERVLSVADLASKLETALNALHANDDDLGKPRAFTAAEFALQLVEGAQAVRFGSGWSQ